MLQVLKVKPANVATAKPIVRHSAANNAKKTVIANAAMTVTTVTASASASVPTVRINRAGHTNERPVYGDSVLVDRSFFILSHLHPRE